MGVIEEVRLYNEDLAKTLKKHTGIRKLVEDLYPDSAHFIYELLQNAEDTGATEAIFRLEDQSLFFEHNGRPFEPRDIYAITDIGEGTKANDEDKIGRFGIGFKSVFAYSETPYIWSPTFSFKISELVLPTEIDGKTDRNTRFEFPFNNPKKAAEDAHHEISLGLDELAETSLLFLSSMESIHWQVGDQPAGEVLRIEHSQNHVEVLKQFDGGKTTNSHFLRFSKLVDGLKNQNVTVAFELDFLPAIVGFDSQKGLFKQFKIIPANPGRVAVFFPAVKETSGLRFHLHAPFVPELSRASIKETSANDPLFVQIAGLVSASLHLIRDLKLLTGDFLGVLPNSHDKLSKRYEPIRNSIISEMNNYPLTPIYLSKKHLPAKKLLQAKASLKSLLSGDDLEFLVDFIDIAPQWAIGAQQKNSNVDRFLSDLAIQVWDIEAFVKKLQEKTTEEIRYIHTAHTCKAIVGQDADFMEWLGTKSEEWHQKFYALLQDELLVGYEYIKRQSITRLKPLRIIRLTDGSYNVGHRSYFPTSGLENDKLFSRVDMKVYTSGKNKTQQSSAFTFLENIGVGVVGEAEQVDAILNKRYSRVENAYSEKTYLNDLKRFISFAEKEPDKINLFEEYHIFKSEEGEWVLPENIALDKPFIDTGLGAYCDAIGDENELARLSLDYLEFGIELEEIVFFATSVGAHCDLEICLQSTSEHYLKDDLRRDYYLPRVKWTSTAIDRDWSVPNLSTALRKPSVELFKLIWRTMTNAGPKVIKAQFRPNQGYPIREEPSSLIGTLGGNRWKWVPQEEGIFVSAKNVCFEKLPHGYTYDEDFEWLTAIGFGEKNLQMSEERKKINVAAKDVLGTDDINSVEDAKWFVGLSEEDRREFREAYQSRHASDLPEQEPRNSDLRFSRVGQRAVNAPERTTEQRTRTVSTGLGEIKQAAEQYLRQQYTNSDSEMICQICKKKLPFKLKDGNYYVEKVEFLQELQRRHLQNYIALCPNHAAMFQHANGSRDLLKGMLIDVDNNYLEVVLADENTTLYFTKTHIADLKAVIAADTKAEAGSKVNSESIEG